MRANENIPVKEALDAAPKLAKHGEIGRGRIRGSNGTSKRGNIGSYLASRIKRDHPDINPMLTPHRMEIVDCGASVRCNLPSLPPCFVICLFQGVELIPPLQISFVHLKTFFPLHLISPEQMRLSCPTQEEIAKVCECSRDVAQQEIEDFVEKVLQNQIHKAAANHATDFEPQKKRDALPLSQSRAHLANKGEYCESGAPRGTPPKEGYMGYVTVHLTFPPPHHKKVGSASIRSRTIKAEHATAVHGNAHRTNGGTT